MWPSTNAGACSASFPFLTPDRFSRDFIIRPLLMPQIDQAAEKIDQAVKLAGGKFALGHVNQAIIKMTKQDMKGAMKLLKKVSAVLRRCVAELTRWADAASFWRYQCSDVCVASPGDRGRSTLRDGSRAHCAPPRPREGSQGGY